MTPMSAAMLAMIAALISMSAAATSLYLKRERRQATPAARDLGDLEQAVEDLVRRLEAAAGRCIHDLESREAELRALLGAGEEPAISRDGPADGAPAIHPPAFTDGAGGDAATSTGYFETDLVSRAARACELAQQRMDEASICRILGMQRSELRLVLGLRTARQEAA